MSSLSWESDCDDAAKCGSARGKVTMLRSLLSQISFVLYVRDICGLKHWPEQTEVIYSVFPAVWPFPFQSGRIMVRFHSVGMT